MDFFSAKSRRRLVILAAVPCVAYVLLMAAVLMFQRRLMYFPTRIPAARVEAVAADNGFAPWRDPAGRIIGWWIAGTDSSRSVLVCHGNAGCALNRDYIARPVHEATGASVFVLEYPGYGARAGAPGRRSFDAAADEAFALLPAGTRKYVVSESIGTGVATGLAARHPGDVAGLVLFVSYHRLASVAQRQFPFLPAALLLADRFDPETDLRRYHGPVQFVVAGADEMLGAETGKRLAAGYRGPKRIQVVPGAGHNDVASQPAAWWREVAAFWAHPAP